MAVTPLPALRYRAFLSYSHRDSAVTAMLHRRLETFRVPRGLRGSGRGELPSRLHPVFRDRDELASASRLSDSIRSALDESEALVVVCSPAAVASPWVGEEIAYFRRTYSQRPVLAFVVGGDPGLDPRLDAAHAALPLALALEDVDAPDGVLGEPLAADARPEADGFTSAFFKLVAGLLEVRYDDLRRRDQKRRQRRWGMATAAALILSCVLAWLAWDATVARDAARVAQARAELELRSEQQTREFLISVFQLADANEARGNNVTVREVLDRAVQRIDRSRFDRPAIRARFLATLGQAYSSLGLNRRGAELLQQSLDAPGDDGDDPEARRQAAESRIVLADTLYEMGDYPAALQALDRFDPSGVEPLLRAQAANVRGDVLAYLERDDEALAQYRDAIAQAEAGGRAGQDAAAVDAIRARARVGLATLALFAGDVESAELGYADAVALLRAVFGDDHPRTIAATGSLGSASYRAGHRDAARQAWTQALERAERVYEPGGPEAGTLSNNLGLLLFEDGELQAAEPLLRAALDSDRRHRSEDFDDLAYPLHNLGYLLLVRGQLDEAGVLLEEALRIAEANRHRMLAPILNALADLYCLRGDAQPGASLAQRGLALLAAAGDEVADPWRKAQLQLTAYACATGAGENADPKDARAALAQLRQRWPEASPFVQRGRAQLASRRR